MCSVSLWSAGGESEVTEVNFSSLAGRPHMSSFWGKIRKTAHVVMIFYIVIIYAYLESNYEDI